MDVGEKEEKEEPIIWAKNGKGRNILFLSWIRNEEKRGDFFEMNPSFFFSYSQSLRIEF